MRYKRKHVPVANVTSADVGTAALRSLATGFAKRVGMIAAPSSHAQKGQVVVLLQDAYRISSLHVDLGVFF